MKPTTLLFLLLLLLPIHHSSPPLTTATTTTTTTEPSYISFLISTKGLNFLKDLLISKAISALTPLYIPSIDESLQIPFLGNVFVNLSSICLHQIRVSNSSINPGNTGIAFIVSGATANVSLDWYYSYYSGWIFPLQFSDHGIASIQVGGMQVGLTLYLEIQEGRLKLSLLECGCFVQDLSINVYGGASWLYQGIVDVFVGKIESAIEDTLTKKLKEAISTLDSFVDSLPKEIPIDDISSINVTFVNDLVMSNSSIGLDINGLFIQRDQTWKYKFNKDHLNHDNSLLQSEQKARPKFFEEDLQVFSCPDSSKMMGILIDEAVFHSASTLYFETGSLQWIVDKIPEQALLNTAGWRFIVPQLYKKYPNDPMNLNISFISPPILTISSKSVDVTSDVDLTIDVLEDGQIVPVACILMEIHASGSIEIRGNNLVGKVKVRDFNLSLKWSNIGNLKMFLIQPVIRTVIETVLVPYTNARLWRGFKLPMIHGFSLKNARTSYLDLSIMVCSDVSYSDVDNYAHSLLHIS